MRLVIATGIYPPDHGGPATFVPALASWATHNGCEVEVVTLAKDTNALSDVPWHVTRIRREQFKPARVARTIFAIARILRRSDILFANGLYEESAVAAKLTGHRWIAKVVGDPVWERHRNRHPYGPSLDEFNETRLSLANSLRRFFLFRALRSTSMCVTPSVELQELLQARHVAQTVFIPNGVKIEPTSNAVRDIDVVTVCRLVPWKHVDVLLRACHNAGLSLHIVGDGPLMNDLKKLAESLGSTSKTFFHGHCDHTTVRQLVDRSKVFALNSSYEGMSFSLLEAMSRQKAVVVGQNSGNHQVVEHGKNGLVVDPQNSEEVENAIRELILDDARATNLARNARLTIEERFSEELTLTRTLGLINSVEMKGT